MRSESRESAYLSSGRLSPSEATEGIGGSDSAQVGRHGVKKVTEASKSKSRVNHLSQTTAALFPRVPAMEALEMRVAVLRIPEVQSRLRTSQMILDDIGAGRVGDLATWMLSEDSTFIDEPGLSPLIENIVQVALFDRYLRFHRMPDFIIGAVRSDESPSLTAADLCADLGAFSDSIRNSKLAQSWLEQSEIRLEKSIQEHSVPTEIPKAFEVSVEPDVVQVKDKGLLPVGLGLAPGFQSVVKSKDEAEEKAKQNEDGQNSTRSTAVAKTGSDGSLEDTRTSDHVQTLNHPNETSQFMIYKQNAQGVWEVLDTRVGSIRQVVEDCHNEVGISRFVSFGLGEVISLADSVDLNLGNETGEITATDVIDLDPYLSWFWRDLKPAWGMVN